MGKVIIIGTSHPFRGGLAAFNERLALEFQKQGHEVRIETFTLQYPGILFPGKTQYADWPAPGNLNIIRSINSVWPPGWFRLARRIRKEKPDIVVFKYWLPFMAPCFGTIARQIKKNRFTRIICILDNIIPHEKRVGDMPLTRYFVKPVDGFIAMSKTVLNDLDIFTKKKPRLFSPHPVFDNFGAIVKRDKALSNLGLDTESRYILFFGLIRDYKGLDLLIKAFSNTKLRDMNLKLLVAGEFYSSRKPYDDLIAKYKLENEVLIFPEFIPDSKVANWFCAADLIAQPYKSATQSGVTQIGYHFEKPMLVTNVGGLPEIIPHMKAGYVVERDPDEIAVAIIDFYENKRYKELVEGVRSEKVKYSWETMVKNISLLTDQIESR